MMSVRLHARAADDVRVATAYYLKEAGGRAVARRFAASFAAQIERIGEYPAAGSPRFAGLLGIPNLRSMPIESFPFTVFYIVSDQEVTIMRVLHNSRDIPCTFGE